MWPKLYLTCVEQTIHKEDGSSGKHVGDDKVEERHLRTPDASKGKRYIIVQENAKSMR